MAKRKGQAGLKVFEASDYLDSEEVIAEYLTAALEDPDTARTEYENPMGKSVFEESANRFVTGDVLVHTWDLARAVGADVTLPADEVDAVWMGDASGFGEDHFDLVAPALKKGLPVFRSKLSP